MKLLYKIIAVMAVLIIMTIAGFSILAKEKSGGQMDVRVDVFLDNSGYVHIVDVNSSFREVNRFSMVKGDEMELPAVVANVIYKGDLIGYWASEKLDPFAPINSTKSYNLQVGLFENPVHGENVTITVRILGYRGEELESLGITYRLP